MRKTKTDMNELRTLIADYVEGKETITSIAKKLGIARRSLYSLLENRFIPNPIEYRQVRENEFFEMLNQKIKMGYTKERLTFDYPDRIGTHSFDNWYRSGKIDQRPMTSYAKKEFLRKSLNKEERNDRK